MRFPKPAACLILMAASLSAANIPRPAKEFAFQTPGGKQALLSEHRGKVIALLFILTTCPHCQQVTQSLSQLQKEYGAKGLQVLSVALEDNAAAAVPGFIKRFQTPYPVGWVHWRSAAEYLQHPTMLRMMMPQLILIDRSSTIRAQYAGNDQFFGPDQAKNLRGAIEGLLKGASAKKKG